MRLLYMVLCAVSLARLPVYAATIAKMLPLDTLKALDMPADNDVETRQIHSADFSSNIPSSTSMDVQDVQIPGSSPESVATKAGHRTSAKFIKRASENPVSFLSKNYGGKPQVFDDSEVLEGPDSATLATLKRIIVSDIVEKMPVRGRDVSLPSGVNSHTVDPNSIPSYVGLQAPPDGVESVINQQHALSKMISRGIEHSEFIRPQSINFSALSDGDSGDEHIEEDGDENETTDDGNDSEGLEEEEDGDSDNSEVSGDDDNNDDGSDDNEEGQDSEDNSEDEDDAMRQYL
ncbi:hypothetical protein BJ165DRAFT_1401829 [Panaeolus papilionaceus]|nr:hypothetical protein BJ165DRAFT_1401829 [Panaeolus papilionaceus]